MSVNTHHGVISYRSNIDKRVSVVSRLVPAMLVALAVAVLAQFSTASIHLMQSERSGYEGVAQQLDQTQSALTTLDR